MIRNPTAFTRGDFEPGKLGELLPQSWFETSVLEVPLAYWIVLLLLVAAAWIVAWFLVMAIKPLVRSLVARTESDLDDRVVRRLAPPAVLLLALGIFSAGTYPLRLVARAQELLTGLETGLAVVGFAWAAMRLLDVGAGLLDIRFERADNAAARSAVPLARRSIKVLLLVIAMIALLQNLGFEVTGLIAGLGVGGLAFALAAQKSIENLFGGVTLITDRPVKVGDFCRYADGKLGTVAEIGLRSTRILTPERTLVTIPNAIFSELQLESFATRDQIRLLTTLGLRYETSADQLRYVLTRLREVLVGHPRVAEEPLRVRFSGFGAHSLDLEVLAYVDTPDFNEFCAIREDLFLRFIDVVEEAGTGFAFPSQTLYVGRDHGLSADRVEHAEKAVREWRREGRLPSTDSATAGD